MALKVGDIYADVGYRLDETNADKFERRNREIERKVDRPINQELGFDTEDRGAGLWERAVDRMRGKASRPIRAKATFDVDTSGADAYVLAVDRASVATDIWQDKAGRWRNSAGQFASDGEKAAAGIGAIGKAADGAGGGVGGLTGRLGGLSGGLRPLLAIAGALAPLFLLLGGAAVALGGSFAAATAGVGALTIGLGVALTPLVALATAVTQRFGLIQEASAAMDAQAEKGASTARSSAAARAAAAQQIEGAEQSLNDAQRAQTRAQEELTEAREKAKRELVDLALAADRSVTSEKRASLALDEAIMRAAETRADPAARRREIADADLAVQEARDSLRQMRLERARAHEDERRGTTTVVDAERQLEDAKRNTARAQKGYRDASAGAALALADQGAAADAVNAKLGKLTATERRLLETFRSFKDRLRDTFEPATDAVFNGVDRGLRRLTPRLGAASDEFQALGEEVGDVFDRAAGNLAGPEWSRAFDKILTTARRIVRPLSNAVGSVAETVRNIAVAVLPDVEDLADGVERVFGNMAEGTEDTDKVRGIIGDLVDHTKSWMRFLRAAGDLLITVFGGGREEGQGMVDTMTDLLEKWDRFLETEEGQREMRRFFRDAVKLARDLAGLIATAVGAIYDMANGYSRASDAFDRFEDSVIIGMGFIGESMRTQFAQVFDFILGGLTTVMGGISSAATGLSKLPGGGRFKGVAREIDNARDSIDGYRRGLRDAGKESDAVSHAKLRRENRDTAKTFKGLESDGRASMSDIRKSVDHNTKRIKERLGTDSKAGRDALAENFASAARAVRRSMERGVIATDDGLKEIRRLMEAEFVALGFTKREAAAAARGASGRFHKQDEPAAQAPANARGGRIKRAGGGWLGAPGMVGMDSIERTAPSGSSVLNRHQLPIADMALRLDGSGGVDGLIANSPQGGGGPMVPYIGAPGELELGPAATSRLDQALARQGFGNLDSLFSSVNTPHYMARGGIVPVPGFRGEEAHSSVISKITSTARKFGLTLTDAFDRNRDGGHSSPGHNVTGTAADFWGPDRNMDAAVKALVEAGYRVGYDGRFGSQRWPGHGPTSVAGRNAHLHVEFGGKGGAIAGAIGRAAKALKRVRARGVSGGLGRLAQTTLDRTRTAADQRIEEAASAMGGNEGAGPGPGRGGAGKAANEGQVRSWLYQGLKLAGLPPTSRNISILYGRAMQESGGNPKAQNNWDSNARRGTPSKGLLQTIEPTFRAHMVRGYGNIWNPVHNVAAAVRYMMSRYGRLVASDGKGYQGGGRIGNLAGRVLLRNGGGRVDVKDIGKLRGMQTDRVEDYEQIVGTVETLRAKYSTAERRYNQNDVELIDPKTGAPNTAAINEKMGQLRGLRDIRRAIAKKLEEAQKIVRRIVKTYKGIVAALKASLSKAKKKDRKGIEARVEAYEGKLTEWRGKDGEIGDNVDNAWLDYSELDAEVAELRKARGGDDNIRQARADDADREREKAVSDAVGIRDSRFRRMVAEAALTPDKADDIAASREQRDYWEGELDRLRREGGSDADIASAAESLASARQNFDQLTAPPDTTADQSAVLAQSEARANALQANLNAARSNLAAFGSAGDIGQGGFGSAFAAGAASSPLGAGRQAGANEMGPRVYVEYKSLIAPSNIEQSQIADVVAGALGTQGYRQTTHEKVG